MLTATKMADWTRRLSVKMQLIRAAAPPTANHTDTRLKVVASMNTRTMVATSHPMA